MNETNNKEKTTKVRLRSEHHSIQRFAFTAIRHATTNSSFHDHQHNGGVLQRQCDCGKHTIGGGECETCRQKHGASFLQRTPGDGSAENRTGIPDDLKIGLEQLSGFDLSGVRVHHNSSKPTQFNALAYAQGQDIHLGPGQEEHLPHEGWHVVQQMQGRVKPTMQLNVIKIRTIGTKKESQ